MGRGTRTLVVVAVAIAVAAVATYAVYQALQRAPVRQVQMPTVQVVVAKRALPAGSRLTKDDIKLTEWPATAPVQGGFSRIEDVDQRGLMSAIVENEPLTESKLAPKEAGAGLPPTIPPGMRAMSIKVNEVVGVAGFVVPGTRVDVIVTTRGAQGTDSMSRVVLSNTQVLAAGTRYDQEKSKDGAPIPAAVVTLLLTPADAERVALATAEGTIVLALRNPLDGEPTVTQGVRMASLFGAPAPPPQQRVVRGAVRMVQAVPPPAPKPYTVETIRAAKRTEEVVR